MRKILCLSQVRKEANAWKANGLYVEKYENSWSGDKSEKVKEYEVMGRE